MTSDDELDAALKSVTDHWEATTQPAPPFPQTLSSIDPPGHRPRNIRPARRRVLVSAAVAILVSGVLWASLVDGETTKVITTDDALAEPAGTALPSTVPLVTALPATTVPATAPTLLAPPTAEAAIDKLLTTSPDGRFTYFHVAEGLRPGPILVDDGTGLRAAMNDRRDLYLLEQPSGSDSAFRFIDDTTVIWESRSGSGFHAYIGRIDDQGMILDITPRDRFADEEWVWLADFEPAAVMSSGRDLNIDTGSPLVDLIEERSPLADGNLTAPGWFLGDTLGSPSACGGKTLYRTTADGFARALDSQIEIDQVVSIHGTETFNGPAVDAAGIERHLAIATACPESYDGVQLRLASEFLSYGDGGPRNRPTVRFWDNSPVAFAFGVTEFQAITGIERVNCDDDEFDPEVVVVDVINLDGAAARYRVEREYNEFGPSIRSSRLPIAGVATADEDLCTLTVDTLPDPADVGPSQSPESAERDGIPSFLAELPLSERSTVIGAVEVQGQRWVLTKFPDELRATLREGFQSSGYLMDTLSSELLLVEDGKVISSILNNHLPMRGIISDDRHVIVHRRGDGGYPDSAVFRLNVETGETERWILPFPDLVSGIIDWDWAREAYPDWQFPTDESAQRLLDALDNSDGDAQLLTALTEALNQATPR